MPTTFPQLLTPDETAQILGVSRQTLAVWRCTKRYTLSYVRCGRLIRYRAEDIEAFIARHTHGGVPDPV